MKHIFVVNPVSGKGKNAKNYIPTIEKYIKEKGINADIYVTTAQGDGMRYVENVAKNGEPVRFYSCGGDGTLYEIVNGCYKYPNCEVANIPLGSGNDFSRLFGRNTNIDDHINGVPVKLDLIETNGQVAINECAMGVDSEVCAGQADFKKLPMVNGEIAYTLSALNCVIKGKVKNHFKITIDNDKVYEDDFLFCYIGNSRWYGGGYMAAPGAMPNDGLIDCVMVKYPPEIAKKGVFGLVPLLLKYKKGEHLSWEFTKLVHCKHVKIESTNPAAVNVDGECAFVTEREFKLLEGAITFIVPRGSKFLDLI
ncbi:MAG: YegS/Rv2252/BmrU family lipid kinase [Clostridia bacterium]|nr:YegS/Rv2252/BmrU family lipid kinase [Clostridia bacterium]